MKKISNCASIGANITLHGLLVSLLFLCFEAKSQLIANAGGPYMVDTESSVVLDGSALIPGDNLGEIVLALHNYESAYMKFPPAIVTDNTGNPLYSWRVLILPFMGYVDLYNEFDLTKAWDDPVNFPLLDPMPAVFRRLGAIETDNYTDFVAPSAANAAFFGTDEIRIQDFTDGTSNTIIVAESAQTNIPWSAPIDVDPLVNPSLDDASGFSSYLDDVILASTADGAVLFLENDALQVITDEMFSRNSGIPVDFSSIVVDPGTIDTYEWDLDDDGVFETAGADPTFNAIGLAPGDYPVHMRVTTTSGITTTVSSNVEVDCVNSNNIVWCARRKIVVCHVPQGNPANAHEVCVKIKNAIKHITRHSEDYLGYCDCNSSGNRIGNADDVTRLVEIQTPLKIYPNPVSNLLQVSIWSEHQESINLQIIDFSGQIFTSLDQHVLDGENLFELNVSNLNEGLYLLRVRSETRDDVIKVVKARD